MGFKGEWKEQWFHDVPKVIHNTLQFYDEIQKDPYRVTAKQTISERKWVLEKTDVERLVQALEELGVLYIPSKLEPGPLFLFPELDVFDIPVRAQTKPLYELLRASKYVTFGNFLPFVGPIWIGSQNQNIQRILDHQSVIICEGPFDLLALRVATDFPSLCALTKKVNHDQVKYLRSLGVKRAYLMFDNEQTEAGEKAMKNLVDEFKGELDMVPLLCPAGDPSECLEASSRLSALRSILNDL